MHENMPKGVASKPRSGWKFWQSKSESMTDAMRYDHWLRYVSRVNLPIEHP